MRQTTLCDLPPDLLPLYLRHGLPPPLSADFADTFWHQPHEAPSDIPTYWSDLLGASNDPRHRAAARRRNRTLRSLLDAAAARGAPVPAKLPDARTDCSS